MTIFVFMKSRILKIGVRKTEYTNDDECIILHFIQLMIDCLPIVGQCLHFMNFRDKGKD